MNAPFSGFQHVFILCLTQKDTVIQEHCFELHRQLEGVGMLEGSCGSCHTVPAGIAVLRHSWSARMWLLGLPGLSSLYWFLATVPVQLMCECLALRLSQRPEKPSKLSIKQVSS